MNAAPERADARAPRLRPERARERLERLRERLAQAGVEALLVTEPANVRYLSGFTSPEDGRVLVTADEARLFTDGRYTVQAEEESALPVEITRPWIPRVAALTGEARLAVEAEHATLALARELSGALGREPLPLAGRELLTPLRAVKDADEIELVRRAAALTDEAMAHALTLLRPGASELDVAWEIERFLRSRGATPGFEIIVASGWRSSMPHGVASDKAIADGDLVTLDFGARLHGYTADMTRTVAVGEVDDDVQALYRAVLEAEEAALAAVAPGVRGSELDAIARELLASHGLDAWFSHSLGHGVGLAVHESPRLAQSSDDVLEPGMVVTVEPGVYKPNEVGVRIEDLVLVTDDGHEVLSQAPKGFQRLDV